MNYNPYDLVPLLINGKPMQGRPFEFDSDIVNQKTMQNAFGAVVKPSKVMSMCPDCSQGLEITLKLGDPPFEPAVWSCQYCKPAPPPMVDPFVNPVKTGRVPPQELDPILLDPAKPLEVPVGNVADRFLVPPEPAPAPAPAKPAPRPAQQSGPKKNKKKAKTGQLPLPATASKPVPTPAPLATPPQEPKRPVLIEQVVPPRSSDAPHPDDPFTLTRTEPIKPVLEKAEGLGEEQDFDDSDMVEGS